MNRNAVIELLKDIQEVAKQNIYVTGSWALKLHGIIDREPNDIDITIPEIDIDKNYNIWMNILEKFEVIEEYGAYILKTATLRYKGEEVKIELKNIQIVDKKYFKEIGDNIYIYKIPMLYLEKLKQIFVHQKYINNDLNKVNEKLLEYDVQESKQKIDNAKKDVSNILNIFKGDINLPDIFKSYDWPMFMLDLDNMLEISTFPIFYKQNITKWFFGDKETNHNLIINGIESSKYKPVEKISKNKVNISNKWFEVYKNFDNYHFIFNSIKDLESFLKNVIPNILNTNDSWKYEIVERVFDYIIINKKNIIPIKRIGDEYFLNVFSLWRLMFIKVL